MLLCTRKAFAMKHSEDLGEPCRVPDISSQSVAGIGAWLLTDILNFWCEILRTLVQARLSTLQDSGIWRIVEFLKGLIGNLSKSHVYPLLLGYLFCPEDSSNMPCSKSWFYLLKLRVCVIHILLFYAKTIFFENYFSTRHSWAKSTVARKFKQWWVTLFSDPILSRLWKQIMFTQ